MAVRLVLEGIGPQNESKKLPHLVKFFGPLFSRNRFSEFFWSKTVLPSLSI